MSDVPITSARRHAKAESGFSPAQQAVTARPVNLGPAVFSQTQTSPRPLRHSLPHPSQHPAVGLPVVQGSKVLPEPGLQPPQQRQSEPVARLRSPSAGPMPRRAAPAGVALTGIRKTNIFPSPDAYLKRFYPEPDVRSVSCVNPIICYGFCTKSDPHLASRRTLQRMPGAPVTKS